MRNSGFSLVETMVGGTILFMVLAGVGKMISMSMKDTQRMKQTMVVVDYQNLVRTALSNPNACSLSLAGLSFKASDASTYPNVELFHVTPFGGDYFMTAQEGDKVALTVSSNFVTTRQFTVPVWSLTATVTADGKRINWSNGDFHVRTAGGPMASFQDVLGVWYRQGDITQAVFFTGGKGPRIVGLGDTLNGATLTRFRLVPPSTVTTNLPQGRTPMTMAIDMEVTRVISASDTRPSTASYDAELLVATNAAGLTKVVGCKWEERSLAGSAPVGSCPAGQYLTGFDSTGAYICSTPAAVTGGSCANDEYVKDIQTNGAPVCKKLPKPIFCSKSGNQAIVMNAHNVVSFTAADCGGTLPDARYSGAASQVDICGGVTGFTVLNSGQPGGPGIDWWPSIPSGCNGYIFRAVYTKTTL